MDLFGHTALSLLAGRAVASDPGDRRATTVAALTAGLLPDADVVSYLGGADLFLAVHQRYTHNAVAIVVLPLVVGAVVGHLGRARWPLAMAAAYLGMGLHVGADVCGIWPVPLAWPFGEWRFCFALLEQDFSWPLDLVMVLGAAISLWTPVADRPWAVRIALAASIVAGAIVLLA
jgi:membrane-bound metal-dependent hydrolase YbcI (DUF457 family)